jgi:hypothetical protein
MWVSTYFHNSEMCALAIKQVCESEAMLAGMGWNTLALCVGNG